MRFRSRQFAWPEGSTFVIQGTVAEDATAGTHVCSLTVTPGAGNEMEFLYGKIINGNTATQQNAFAFIDDGTNILTNFLLGVNDTTANINRSFPSATLPSANTNSVASYQAGPGLIVSGSMRLVLQVSTAAVSVTQTFAVVLRVLGGNPTATLADTVGTPTLTFNTNAFFG